MATTLQLQIAAKRAEEAKKKAEEEAGIDTRQRSGTASPFEPRTFIHLTAGATTILPDGRKISFLGPKGGIGEYTAKNADEQEWLDELALSRTSQVTELLDNTTAQEAAAAITDPVVQQAAIDAAANSLQAANPAVVAATEQMGTIIAKTA